MLVWQEEFYIDALNVFLVTLTSLVGLTTAIFSRPYMRVERDHGKMTPPRSGCTTACTSCSASRCCWR
jgi:hydrogenase-4 component F